MLHEKGFFDNSDTWQSLEAEKQSWIKTYRRFPQKATSFNQDLIMLLSLYNCSVCKKKRRTTSFEGNKDVYLLFFFSLVEGTSSILAKNQLKYHPTFSLLGLGNCLHNYKCYNLTDSSCPYCHWLNLLTHSFDWIESYRWSMLQMTMRY